MESCSVTGPKGTYPFWQPALSSAVVCIGGISSKVNPCSHVGELKCKSLSAESTDMSTVGADSIFLANWV